MMTTRFTNSAGQPITLAQLAVRTAVYAVGMAVALVAAYWTTVLVFCL